MPPVNVHTQTFIKLAAPVVFLSCTLSCTSMPARAAFNPDATACTYPATTDIRTLSLADTAGDDSAANAATINAAIVQANTDLGVDPDKTIVLKIPAGTWEVGGTGPDAIVLHDINRDRVGDGWLVISGDTMQNTTLNFTNFRQRSFEGSHVYRVHLCNLHITRAQETVTQGTIVGFLPEATWSESTYPYGDETLTNIGPLATGADGQMAQVMVLDLHSGFPELNQIYDEGAGATFNCSGRYIRKYRYSGVTPVIELDNNGFTPWLQKWKITGAADPNLNGKWAIGLGRPGHLISQPTTAKYQAGDQLAIKSKKTRDAVWFAVGHDIVLENIRLTRATRVLLRGGTVTGDTMDNVRISNLAVERMPAIGGRIPMIASAEGGPQLVGVIQPPAPTPPPSPPPPTGPCATSAPPAVTPLDSMTNAVIEDVDILATGDDGIGVFNVSGLEVRRTSIVDPLGRGMAFADGATTPCVRALINRAPILIETPAAFSWGCVTDSTPPAAATAFAAGTMTAGRVELTWSAVNPADFDGFEIRRRLASATAGSEVPVVIGTRATAYNDLSIKPATSYVYSLYSFDKSRNYSTATTLSVTTP